MYPRAHTDRQVLLNAGAATGVGTAFECIDFRNIEIDVIQAAFTGTVQIAASNADTKPDFTASASASNPWAYIKCIDLIDGSAVNGGTGVVGAGTTSVRMLEANTNAVRWICPIITSYTSGAVTVAARGVGNM